MAVISIAAIIIYWQVHDHPLVNVVKLGGKGFQIRKWVQYLGKYSVQN